MYHLSWLTYFNVKLCRCVHYEDNYVKSVRCKCSCAPKKTRWNDRNELKFHSWNVNLKTFINNQIPLCDLMSLFKSKKRKSITWFAIQMTMSTRIIQNTFIFFHLFSRSHLLKIHFMHHLLWSVHSCVCTVQLFHLLHVTLLYQSFTVTAHTIQPQLLVT